MNKKILQIGSSINCGAPGKIAEQIGLLAIKKGWDVYMAHGLRHSNPSKLKTIPMVTPSEEKIHALYSLLLDRQGLGPDGKTKMLVEWIKENKPDVIHLHNIHGHFLNYQTLFKYLVTTEIPIVWTFHDFWPITGHCAHFDHIDCNKWKTNCYRCPLSKAYPKSLFFDRSRQNYITKKELFSSIKQMVIAPVSNWAGSFIKDSFLKHYPILPIYNGVDVNVFTPISSNKRKLLGLDDKCVLVGVASPWSSMKGFNDYMKLREQLSDKYAIIMIGLNPKEMSNIPDGIIGIPRTQNQLELAEYYSMADIVLNLSYQETFGMTTVEGMACGTPVIVYKKTASPELITSETGIVVEAGNLNNLLQAIETIYKNGKAVYSEKCRERAVQKFDKEKCFEEYVKLYNNLIKR